MLGTIRWEHGTIPWNISDGNRDIDDLPLILADH
jgi:hypothetical protein